MKSFLGGVCLIICCFMGVAQENPLPKVDLALFSADHKQQIDTSAHAVVLYEHGRTELQYSPGDGGLMVFHTRHVRVKILDKQGVDAANVEIPLYQYGSKSEYVRDVKGVTYNLENGQLTTEELKRDAIFSDQATAYRRDTRFTLPSIRENSIIDYSYTLISPNFRNFRTWYFQSELPKVYSEYVAVVPATFDYHTNLKGFYPLNEQKNSVLRQYFLLNGVRQDCSRMTYIMRDIPAFKEEAFMLAPINYISSINYELAKYYSPAGRQINFAQEWSDIDRELMSNPDFGGQIKNTKAFREILSDLLQGTDSDLAKAQAIYYYIQSNINWSGYLGKYAEQGITKTLQSKKGNTGDINLALVAGLNAAGIEAFPVIISTRQNGIPGTLNPVLTDFNAVICLIKINGEQYLLDASEKRLPFGQLSMRSVNDRGRVIYSKKQSEWVPLENKIPAKTTYNIVGKIDEGGTLSGTITGIYSGLNALNKRDEIDEYPSFDEYEEHLMETMSAIRILNSEIENLEDLDKPFIEKLEFELDMREGFNDVRIVLNPIIYSRMSSNPFTLQTRSYHVDLGAAQSEVFNINISIPEGYDLVHKPNNSNMSLPDGVARYGYQSNFNNQLLILQQSLSLNQAIFTPEEYFHLKEFFARIIQQQLEDFQFKKTEV